MTLKESIELAHAELAEEAHRAAVDAAKTRIRKQMAMPWWQRLIPFTITIQRRNDNV
jgi:hypothetical protein